MRILSVDVGGTKTILVDYDYDADTVHEVRVGPPCKIHDSPVDKVRSNLRKIMRDLDISGHIVAMGIAGLDTRYDLEIWRDIVSDVFQRALDYVLLNDVEALFYSARYGDPCIVVIAGTGFNSYGRCCDIGAKAGDWGWRIGDDASAYRIGISLLNNAFRYVDGRGGSGKVYSSLLNELGLKDWEELFKWAYDADANEIASLAKVGCRLLSDPQVRRIFNSSVSEAIRSVKAVGKRVGLKGPVDYAGGLFNCEYYRKAFVDGLTREGFEVGKFIKYPVTGPLVKILRDRVGLERNEIAKRVMGIEEEIRRRIGGR